MLASYFEVDKIEAGCDEVGRGCLAGPVFAAAVILPHHFYNPKLNDSKKLSEKTRLELTEIIKKEALAWAIGRVECTEIDKINILNASFLAMHKALDQLVIRPEFIIVDGNRFKVYSKIPHQCIIKGDGKFASIAAASILAKTARDGYMKALHGEFPQYNWAQNVGYPTLEHRTAIRNFGITVHHRKSFRLLNDPPNLLF